MTAPTNALPPAVVAVLQARVATSAPGEKKLRKMRATMSADDRLRGSTLYYGAHTGRWSAGAAEDDETTAQMHNLARGIELDPAWLPYIDAGQVPPGFEGNPRELVASTLRWSIEAPEGRTLVVLDWGQIEARGCAWLCGDREMLTAFREYDAGRGPDIYCVEASAALGRPVTGKGPDRQLGKTFGLGCQYGMGVKRYVLMALTVGVDVVAMGLDPARIVYGWRDRHPAIVRYWRLLETASVEAMRHPGHTMMVGNGRVRFRSRVESDGSKTFLCLLPSGRALWYRGARLGVSSRGETCVVLPGRHGKRDSDMYGGAWLENVMQAMCRDLLAEALVACEAEGVEVVHHVHDEIVAECDEHDGSHTYDRLREIMCRVPAWAKGLPIDAAGYVAQTYRKD